MTTRALFANEWERARELRLRAVADRPAAFDRTLEEESRVSESDWRRRAQPSDTRVVLVEEDGSEFVAMIGVFIDPPQTARLFAMWVDPLCRRSGIGKRLVEEAVAWARQHGAVRVVLDVNEAEGPAIALYRACGFTPTGSARRLSTDPNATAIELMRLV